MSNKEFKLLNKLITSLGYNINEIEDIYDYEEFCEHIIQEQKDLREALKEGVIYRRTYLKSLLDCKEECEKLKDYARRLENQREEYYKELLKKAKALEEIEEFIKNQGINNKWNMRIQRFKSEILKIIRKAKEN